MHLEIHKENINTLISLLGDRDKGPQPGQLKRRTFIVVFLEAETRDPGVGRAGSSRGLCSACRRPGPPVSSQARPARVCVLTPSHKDLGPAAVGPP